MTSANVRDAPGVQRIAVSPWPYFGAALVLCWALLIRLHTQPHGNGHSLPIIVGMWALMTVAMMAPTAVPVLGSLRDILASSSVRPWWAFLAGYLGLWLGFAVAAASAQVWLMNREIVGHGGSSLSLGFSASLLVVAGVYQFTSLKQRCLRNCVHPMTFFLRHWREGPSGAVRMGLRHGVSCIGCCWALMLLAFVGGVASIWFMVLAAAVMAIEKLTSVSRVISATLGVVLVSAGVVVTFAAFIANGGEDGGRPHLPHHQSSAGLVERTKGLL